MDAAKLKSMKHQQLSLEKNTHGCCPVFKSLTGQVLIILEIGCFGLVQDLHSDKRHKYWPLSTIEKWNQAWPEIQWSWTGHVQAKELTDGFLAHGLAQCPCYLRHHLWVVCPTGFNPGKPSLQLVCFLHCCRQQKFQNFLALQCTTTDLFGQCQGRWSGNFWLAKLGLPGRLETKQHIGVLNQVLFHLRVCHQDLWAVARRHPGQPYI